MKVPTGNMGRLDQVLRTGVGCILVYFGFIDPALLGGGWIATALGVFGVVNVVVALVGVCPAYYLADINTRSNEDQ